VAYALKARIVETQQPAVTRQRPVNKNRRMAFSAEFVPMAAHATMQYVMPSLSNNCTTREERHFLGNACEMLSAEQVSQGEFEYFHRSPASRRRR
jgi:hypothetical protein